MLQMRLASSGGEFHGNCMLFGCESRSFREEQQLRTTIIFCKKKKVSNYKIMDQSLAGFRSNYPNWIRIFSDISDEWLHCRFVFFPVTFQKSNFSEFPCPADDWNPFNGFFNEKLGILKRKKAEYNMYWANKRLPHEAHRTDSRHNLLREC